MAQRISSLRIAALRNTLSTLRLQSFAQELIYRFRLVVSAVLPKYAALGHLSEYYLSKGVASA